MIVLLAISLVVESVRRYHLIFLDYCSLWCVYTIFIIVKTRSDAKHAQGARVSEKDEEGNTPLHLVMCFQTSLDNVALIFLLSLPFSHQSLSIFASLLFHSVNF